MKKKLPLWFLKAGPATAIPLYPLPGKGKAVFTPPKTEILEEEVLG